MHCVNLLGQRRSARDFDRQVAEIRIRAAILNAFTALGTNNTVAVGQVRQGYGEVRPKIDLCNKAGAARCKNDGRG